MAGAVIDFRLPEYRREVFHKFYEFHLKYKAHPGAVYYLFPYIEQQNSLDKEQMLWLAYINGNTQNPVMSWLVFKRYPSPEEFIEKSGKKWFNENWGRLQWDMDRRYQKKSFPDNVEWYWQETAVHTQVGYFGLDTDKQADFQKCWHKVRNGFPTFGRLSAFSYLEYLRIVGMNIDCDDLFLEDISGSKSHRNGLAIVLGRNDLDFRGNPSYQPGQIEWLTAEAKQLLEEAKARSRGKNWEHDVSYFTLESALCTYKSWHRPNRRYPNVYNDMLYNRIRWAEEHWPEEDFGIFWRARAFYLPSYLCLENNPRDPGLSKLKQNFYLETGCPVMMSKDYPEFDNEFDRSIWFWPRH